MSDDRFLPTFLLSAYRKLTYDSLDLGTYRGTFLMSLPSERDFLGVVDSACCAFSLSLRWPRVLAHTWAYRWDLNASTTLQRDPSAFCPNDNSTLKTVLPPRVAVVKTRPEIFIWLPLWRQGFSVFRNQSSLG